jgi:twitching motility two-component system response regulator PilH
VPARKNLKTAPTGCGAEQQKPPAQRGSKTRTKTMSKILIVDDLATEQAVMKVIVTKLGHVAITANDGQAGIDAAVKEKPDLILLDVVMPIMDGYTACRKIKKEPATANIPVILVTTKNGESDRFWGLKQGAADYITKPVSEGTLVEAIKKHIR